MRAQGTDKPKTLVQRRKRQEEVLQESEADFRSLAADHKEEQFINRLTPLLTSLKSYIKHRLRWAYADGDITPIYTSDDLLHEVVLRAYERYAQKTSDLTLEQWVYRLANHTLDEYIRQRKTFDRHRKSLEDVRAKELTGLEEHITADAEGEIWAPEDLDDSEYTPPDFTPPADYRTPEEKLEDKGQAQRAVQALSHVPLRERIIFELFVIQGFSKESVANIMDMSSDGVPRIAQKVRAQVLQEIGAVRRKAS